VTIWLAVLFLERALVKLALTVRAHKVLWMVLAVHGRHTAACHGLVTSDAERATSGVEVRLAVRQTLVVVETLCTEWCTTFLHHGNIQSTLTLQISGTSQFP